jgi:hypothetical protein
VSQQDPFTGTWTFRAERSKLSTPPPRRWTQQIHATSVDVRVNEEIVSADGRQTTLTVEARFDGQDYPVSGSPVADAIAYTRVDAYTISGIAKENNSLSLKETLIAASEGNLITLTYSIYRGGREVASGVAVFEKTQG